MKRTECQELAPHEQGEMKPHGLRSLSRREKKLLARVGFIQSLVGDSLLKQGRKLGLHLGG